MIKIDIQIFIFGWLLIVVAAISAIVPGYWLEGLACLSGLSLVIAALMDKTEEYFDCDGSYKEDE